MAQVDRMTGCTPSRCARMPAIPQTLLEDKRRRQSLTLRIGSRKALGFGLLGLAVVLALLWGVRLAGQPEIPEGVSEQRVALIKALGPIRPFEGRLVGFEYAPVGRLPKGWRTDEVAAAIREIDDEVEFRSSPRALADVGVVDLLHGHFDEAAGRLRQAVGSKPINASIASDLAAAYLAVPEARQLFNSLRWSERALEADPQLPTALFNRALCLERLSASQAAIKAWEAYLKADGTSEWAREAAERLRNLREPSYAELWERGRAELLKAALEGKEKVVRELVAEFPQGAREYAESSLLTRWARLKSIGRESEADALRDALGLIGRSIAAGSGDHLVADSVAAIERAEISKDGRVVADLVTGHLRYSAGVESQESLKLDQARFQLMEAEKHLLRAGSPMAAWAAFRRALCFFQSEQYKQANDALAALEARFPQRSRYPALQGRVSWLFGLMAQLRGELGLALKLYETALANFERSSQEDFQGAVYRLRAEAYDNLGDENAAWRELGLTLQISHRVLDPKWRLAIFEIAALLVAGDGEPRLALYFQDEGVSAAEEAMDRGALASSLAFRADLRNKAGDKLGALVDVEEARKRAAAILDDGSRAAIEADISRVEGRTFLSSDVRRAIDLMGSAIDAYRASKYRFYLPGLYLDRARGLRQMGRLDEAEDDLKSGAEQVEIQRRTLTADSLRISFLDQADHLYRELLALQVEQGRPVREVFERMEAGRARGLADLLREGPGRERRTASLPEIQLSLPVGTVLLEYAVLSDKLLILEIRRGSAELWKVAVPEKDLQEHVGAFHKTFWRGTEASSWKSHSATLYDWLIRPWAAQLAAEEKIVVVPHRMLHGIPFSALIRRESGRHLVEDHPITVVPSATAYLNVARSRPPRKDGPLRVLVVGDPTMDRELSASLPGLPESGREVAAVAEVFPGAQVFTMQGATRERVLEAGSYDILHIAAHALPNPELPLLSAFVLAPSPKDSERGLLRAADLYEQSFERTRLVTLGACGTATGRRSASEGLEDLVRPFLAAGVPSVVGTLRQVKDSESSMFFEAFYSRLANSQSGHAQVLRETQLHFLREDRPYWAAFSCFGAC